MVSISLVTWQQYLRILFLTHINQSNNPISNETHEFIYLVAFLHILRLGQYTLINKHLYWEKTRVAE